MTAAEAHTRVEIHSDNYPSHKVLVCTYPDGCQPLCATCQGPL